MDVRAEGLNPFPRVAVGLHRNPIGVTLLEEPLPHGALELRIVNHHRSARLGIRHRIQGSRNLPLVFLSTGVNESESE